MLNKIADGLYCLDSSMHMSPMDLPLRSHIIVDRSGTVIIVSPVQMDDKVVEAIRALGTRFIILAPNLFHHLFVAKALTQFPDAQCVSTEGMDKKRGDIQWSKIVRSGDVISDDISLHRLEGMPKFNEICIFHKPSKTLIVVDLFFNILNPSGVGAFIMLNIFGTYKRFGPSRLFRLMIRDKKLFSESLATILNLPFDRLSLAHGDIVQRNARQLARDAAQRMGLVPHLG
jgi:hypothetical protein